MCQAFLCWILEDQNIRDFCLNKTQPRKVAAKFLVLLTSSCYSINIFTPNHHKSKSIFLKSCRGFLLVILSIMRQRILAACVHLKQCVAATEGERDHLACRGYVKKYKKKQSQRYEKRKTKNKKRHTVASLSENRCQNSPNFRCRVVAKVCFAFESELDFWHKKINKKFKTKNLKFRSFFLSDFQI